MDARFQTKTPPPVETGSRYQGFVMVLQLLHCGALDEHANDAGHVPYSKLLDIAEECEAYLLNRYRPSVRST